MLIGLALFIFSENNRIFPQIKVNKTNLEEGQSFFEAKQVFNELSSSFSQIKKTTQMYNLVQQANKNVYLEEMEDGWKYEKKEVGFSFLFSKEAFPEIKQAELFEIVDEKLNALVLEYNIEEGLLVLSLNEYKEDFYDCEIDLKQEKIVKDTSFFCKDLSEENEMVFMQECTLKHKNYCYEIHYALEVDVLNFPLERWSFWTDMESLILKNFELKVK